MTFPQIDAGLDKCPDPWRFDWPALLEIRKQARQSASTANLYVGALNARNRLAASLRRPPSTPRDSVPLTDSVLGAQCFKPSPRLRRSRTGRIPSLTAGLASTRQPKCPCHRSHIRAIYSSAKASVTFRITHLAQSLSHRFRRKKALRRPILCVWVTGETPHP